jgi:hypothetical protein
MPTANSNRPTILDGDTVRPMTDPEFAQWLVDCDEAEERRAAQARREEARQSALAKLSALGLTESEIAALLGS